MKRALLLGGLAAFAFAAVVFLMLQLMPTPLRDSDYLVIGSVATLVALLALFLLLASTTLKSSELFFKRRKK